MGYNENFIKLTQYDYFINQQVEIYGRQMGIRPWYIMDNGSIYDINTNYLVNIQTLIANEDLFYKFINNMVDEDKIRVSYEPIDKESVPQVIKDNLIEIENLFNEVLKPFQTYIDARSDYKNNEYTYKCLVSDYLKNIREYKGIYSLTEFVDYVSNKLTDVIGRDTLREWTEIQKFVPTNKTFLIEYQKEFVKGKQPPVIEGLKNESIREWDDYPNQMMTGYHHNAVIYPIEIDLTQKLTKDYADKIVEDAYQPEKAEIEAER